MKVFNVIAKHNIDVLHFQVDAKDLKTAYQEAKKEAKDLFDATDYSPTSVEVKEETIPKLSKR